MLTRNACSMNILQESHGWPIQSPSLFPSLDHKTAICHQLSNAPRQKGFFSLTTLGRVVEIREKAPSITWILLRQRSSADVDPRDTVWSRTFAWKMKSTQWRLRARVKKRQGRPSETLLDSKKMRVSKRLPVTAMVQCRPDWSVNTKVSVLYGVELLFEIWRSRLAAQEAKKEFCWLDLHLNGAAVKGFCLNQRCAILFKVQLCD